MNQMFTQNLVCPWCFKGKVLTDGKAQVTLSMQCPRCKHIFMADLSTLKTECSRPQSGLEQHTAD